MDWFPDEYVEECMNMHATMRSMGWEMWVSWGHGEPYYRVQFRRGMAVVEGDGDEIWDAMKAAADAAWEEA